MSISNGQVITDGTASFVVCAKADNNRLSMPLLDSTKKVSINLTTPGDSWTAPSDGFICARKIGSTAGAYVTLSSAPSMEDTLYAQVLFYDFENPSSNLAGAVAVAKGQTYYFTWKDSVTTWFIPAQSTTVN